MTPKEKLVSNEVFPTLKDFGLTKTTTYEKNNLPIEVRRRYCEIIEKYQLISHYENGIITIEDLIEKL